VEQERQRLENKLEALQRSWKLDPEPDILRPHGIPRPFDFQFPDLRKYFEDMGDRFQALKRFQGLKGFEGSGTSLSVRQTPDGVRVEITTRDKDGKESVKAYEAKDPAEFEKKFPEVVKEYGIRFGDDSTFHLRLGPRFDFGLEKDLLPDWFRGRGLDELLRKEPRDRLGLWVEDVDEERAGDLGLKHGQGLRIRKVEANSLAARLGILEDDVLLSINGKTIQGVDTIKNALRATRGSDTVTVEVARAEKGRLSLEARKHTGLRRNM